MKTTQFVRKEDVLETWYLLDATGVAVGRLSSLAANILRGKHRPDYTPNTDLGDHVVIINAEKIHFSGKKLDDKKYYRHTGYPGGLKETNARRLLENHPDRVLKYAVKGMLPKSKLGRKLLKKLKVYAGVDHPHEAQKPIAIEYNEEKIIKAVS